MNFYGLTVSGGYSLGAPIGDAQFKNTTLLLSPSTTQAKSTTTIDSSTNAFTVTRNGNPTTQWPSPYQSIGYWSSYFNGTSSYITFSNTSLLSAVDVATGSDCTYEFWIYPTILRDGSYPYYSPTIWSKGTIYASAVVRADGTFTHYVYNGSPQYVSTAAGAVLVNKWTHVAVVLTNNLVTIYINGVSSGSGTRYAAQLSGQTLKSGVGDVNFSTCFWPGYISNFRIVTSAIYTGAFTPPTAPLTPITNTSLLTFQNNLYKDNSTNNVTLTLSGSPQISSLYPLTTINANQGYFSGLFNGSSTYLNNTTNAVLSSTSPFTIEFWLYGQSKTTSQIIFTQTNSVGAFEIFINTSGVINFGRNNVAVDLTIPSANWNLNTWQHIAIVREGTATNQFKAYVNGTLISTGTLSASLTFTGFYIGAATWYSGGFYLNGYISNFRIVNGTAVYTTNFSPSIIPLRAITNTSLLALQNTTFVDNSTNAFTITATGSPSTNVANPFTTAFPPSNYFPALGAGMYFNGTSDYLTGSAPNLTGSWTVEMWCYWTTSGTQTTIISFNNGSNSGINLWKNTSNQLVADDGINGQTAFSTVTPTINAWNHIAFVRNVTTTSAYVNGVLAGSNSFTPQTTSTVSVGRYNASPYYYFPGYISNLRVVNGIAVYTGAFTPPSLQPLTTAGSTSALCYTSTTNVNTSFAATSTALLLNFIDSNLTDGVFNAGQNNTFLDSGPNSFAITRNGSPTQGALTPYIPNGYWSGYFSSSYLSVADNAALEFGSSSFCIEVFYFPTTTPAAQAIFIKQPNPSTDYGFRILAVNGVLTAYISSGNTSDDIVNGVTFGTLQSNSWNHIAVYRVGTAIYGSLNGTITTLNANTNLSVWNNTGAWVLSASSTGSNPSTGYFSNWRIVVGSSVYTGSSATVPTAPLTAITNTQLLTCQSNRFRDNSSNAFTVTMNGTPSIQAFKPFNPPVAYSPSVYGGSGYFNGTSDWLQIADVSALQFGTGDFTIEMWIYPLTFTSAPLFDQRASGASVYNTFVFYLDTSGKPNFYVNPSPSITFNLTVTLNSWNHLVLIRQSGIASCYLNGVAASNTLNISSVNVTTSSNRLFSSYDPSYYTGYASNLRIVKGTAVYTGTFTPPTLPLSTTGAASVASYSSTTNVNTSFPSTQCSLLTNFTNSGITDFSTNNNLTTVGDAKVSTTAAKYGLASFYFDGTGDYIDMVNSQAFVMGSGNFTVEAWVYPTTTNASHWMFLQGNASGFAAIRIGCQSNQAFLLMSINGSTWTVQSNLIGSVPINTWTYIALTRSSTTVNLYINGSSVYSSSALSTSALMTGIYNIIGRIDPTNLQYFAGYLQDVRLTKGYARYLSNFTTPTDSFTQGGGIGSVPGAPTIGTATKTNSTTATVTFTPPANTGGYAITTYTATSSIGNITGTSTTSPITISGLTSGYGYSFTVTATNSLGVSSPSAASNTVGGLAIRSFQITQMDPIYTLNTTITTAIGITKIQSYTMAILYGDD